MRDGLIVKVVNLWYHVRSDEGVVLCRPRGRVRRQGAKPLVGDRVRFRRLPDGTGAIEEVLPRRNELRRPPVANVDQVLAVVTLVEPPLNLEFLDRALVAAERVGVGAVLALNKADLLGRDGRARAAEVLAIYAAAGYPGLLASAVTGEGIPSLLGRLRGRITVLAGESGVGKSSLLNALVPGLGLRVGAVSARAGRGRHTTRHPELLPLPAAMADGPAGLPVAGTGSPPGPAGGPAGWVVDTPGFSHLDLPDVPPEELDEAFPEMRVPARSCRFRSCLHEREPGCAVKAAVDAGTIDRGRYERYVRFLEEVRRAAPGRG